MANKEISALTAGTALDGTEVFHGVQGGNSRKFTGAQIATLAADGRDLSVDGTKLDGIEALADVTDATNVAAAGAAMLTGATFTGAINASASSGTPFVLNHTDNDAGAGPRAQLVRISTSPALNDVLGTVQFLGRDSGGNSTVYYYERVLIVSPTDGAESGKMEYRAIQAAVDTLEMTVGGGVLLASATGGLKGVGTLNATAVYDDNVLLTDIVGEFAETGTVDLEKWDATVPDLVEPEQRARRETRPGVFEDVVVVPEKRTTRTHKAAKVFKDLIDDGFDPRDPAAYTAKMRERGALPGMPNEAEWEHGKYSIGELHTRSVLAQEMLALAFATVVERLTILEAKG